MVANYRLERTITHSNPTTIWAAIINPDEYYDPGDC